MNRYQIGFHVRDTQGLVWHATIRGLGHADRTRPRVHAPVTPNPHCPPFDLCELHQGLLCLDFPLALAQGSLGEDVSARNKRDKAVFCLPPGASSLPGWAFFSGILTLMRAVRFQTTGASARGIELTLSTTKLSSVQLPYPTPFCSQPKPTAYTECRRS